MAILHGEHRQGFESIHGVKSEIYIPGPGGHPLPYLRVEWDQQQVPLTYEACARQLRDGEPSIEVNTSAKEGLSLASYNLFPGEERIVGWRLRTILSEAK